MSNAASGVMGIGVHGREASRARLSFRNREVSNSRVFHNYIHRYFVIALRIALTAMKQLFSLADVDG